MFHYLFSIIATWFINRRKLRTAIGFMIFCIGFKPKFIIMAPSELLCAGYIEYEPRYTYAAVLFPIPTKLALSYYHKRYGEALC